jgi:hypothetical protein
MAATFRVRLGLCAWGVVFVLLPLVLGCTKGTAHVSGQVTYKGKAVSGGAVTFYGEDGRVDSSPIDAEGNYTIAQAPTGVVKATVTPAQARKGQQPGKHSPGSKPVEHPGKSQDPPKSGKPIDLPPKYEDPTQSGLTFKVTGGKQTINIPLD